MAHDGGCYRRGGRRAEQGPPAGASRFSITALVFATCPCIALDLRRILTIKYPGRVGVTTMMFEVRQRTGDDVTTTGAAKAAEGSTRTDRVHAFHHGALRRRRRGRIRATRSPSRCLPRRRPSAGRPAPVRTAGVPATSPPTRGGSGGLRGLRRGRHRDLRKRTPQKRTPRGDPRKTLRARRAPERTPRRSDASTIRTSGCPSASECPSIPPQGWISALRRRDIPAIGHSSVGHPAETRTLPRRTLPRRTPRSRTTSDRSDHPRRSETPVARHPCVHLRGGPSHGGGTPPRGPRTPLACRGPTRSVRPRPHRRLHPLRSRYQSPKAKKTRKTRSPETSEASEGPGSSGRLRRTERRRGRPAEKVAATPAVGPRGGQVDADGLRVAATAAHQSKA